MSTSYDQEKAQILYNHLKLGDQPPAFRSAVKPHLPEIAERQDFLPETARRLGSKFFPARLHPAKLCSSSLNILRTSFWIPSSPSRRIAALPLR